jgi:hypothetical protein
MKHMTDKAIRKAMLEDYLSSRIHRGEVFIRYKRAEDGKPYACIVALRAAVNGHAPGVLVGWSQCSTKDQFDRKKALRIAVSRALSGQALLSGTELLVAKGARTPAMPLGVLALKATAIAAEMYFAVRSGGKKQEGQNA